MSEQDPNWARDWIRRCQQQAALATKLKRLMPDATWTPGKYEAAAGMEPTILMGSIKALEEARNA